MKLSEWEKSMRKKARQCSAIAYEVGVRDAVGKSAVRIFEQGIGMSGRIGSYNTTDPIYVSVKNSPKTFKRPRKSKGKTFDSYKDYRQAIGRETAFVNLRLSNELYNDYSNVKVSKKVADAGGLKPAKPVKKGKKKYWIVLNKDVNVKKMDGLESKYGEIFGITPKEINEMNKVIEFELARCYDRKN